MQVVARLIQSTLWLACIHSVQIDSMLKVLSLRAADGIVKWQPLNRCLDLDCALFNIYVFHSLRNHLVELEAFLVEPLPFLLQEVGISNKHSPNLPQVLRVLLVFSHRALRVGILHS